jgi:predicted metal-binding membrane protein
MATSGDLNLAVDKPARTVPAFLVGYLLLWSGFLAAVAVGDAILHSVTHDGVTSHDGWLAQLDALLLVAVLLAAATWQLTPIKRACLRSCRTGRVLPGSESAMASPVPARVAR